MSQFDLQIIEDPFFDLPQSADEVAVFDWTKFAPGKTKTRSFSVLDECTHVNGKYVTKTAFIHGSIDGLVFAEEITVEKTGRVSGVVFCRTLLVLGSVTANVICDTVTVKNGGILSSGLKYKKLQVAPGGVISGFFETRRPAA